MLNIFRPVSVQIWGAISSRGLPLLRKVNGNMGRAKYQRDIIHGIEMTMKYGSEYVKDGIAPNVLEELCNSMPRRTADLTKAKGRVSRY